jgi:hypothetical protein
VSFFKSRLEASELNAATGLVKPTTGLVENIFNNPWQKEERNKNATQVEEIKIKEAKEEEKRIMDEKIKVTT